MLKILRYSISAFLLLFSITLHAQDDEESSADKVPAADTFHQLRVGFDIMKPILNSKASERKSYDFELDWYHRKELYFVLEGGFGSSYQDSTYLRYSSKNSFLRVGVSKSILTKLYPGDWDWAFIGMRYAMGFINRTDAVYTIYDPIFGNSTGTVPGVNLTAHWLELTGGVKVELYNGIFAGWNIRGRFILNGKKIRELPPPYIAGYGRGDKNSIFDFNFYLNYAIRWKRKAPVSLATKED